MIKTLVFQVILLFFLTSCSLYESGGRQAIEKNENNIVSPYVVAGLSPQHQHYYVCSRTKELPDFLNEALEVIETPFEKHNVSVLLNSRASPNWIAVYQHNLDLGAHDHCKIYFLKTRPLTRKRILAATKIGLAKIEELNLPARQ